MSEIPSKIWDIHKLSLHLTSQRSRSARDLERDYKALSAIRGLGTVDLLAKPDSFRLESDGDASLRNASRTGWLAWRGILEVAWDSLLHACIDINACERIGWHGKCVCLTRKVDMLVSQVWPTSAKRKWIWLERLSQCMQLFWCFPPSSINRKYTGQRFFALKYILFLCNNETPNFCTAILSAWLSPSLKVDLSWSSHRPPHQ